MCTYVRHIWTQASFFIGNLDENTPYFMSVRGVIEDFA